MISKKGIMVKFYYNLCVTNDELFPLYQTSKLNDPRRLYRIGGLVYISTSEIRVENRCLFHTQ